MISCELLWLQRLKKERNLKNCIIICTSLTIRLHINELSVFIKNYRLVSPFKLFMIQRMHACTDSLTWLIQQNQWDVMIQIPQRLTTFQESYIFSSPLQSFTINFPVIITILPTSIKLYLPSNILWSIGDDCGNREININRKRKYYL